MTKVGVSIGLKYDRANEADDDNYVRGPVNSAVRVKDILIKRFGFNSDDITLLIDEYPSMACPPENNFEIKPSVVTHKILVRLLLSLFESLKEGDILFLYFAGHGSRLRSKPEYDNDTGYVEAICLNKNSSICDFDFRELAKYVPQGCQFVMMTDSCHSGGLFDGSTEVIGDSHLSPDNFGDNERQPTKLFEMAGPDVEPSGVLVSSCQSYESSVGGFITSRREFGTYFTHYFIEYVEETKGKFNFKDLITKVKIKLKHGENITLNPGLYCYGGDGEKLKKKRFLK